MKRCAIYTRKSTEKGLEQEFNSLQAQREACAAFITSQKHEGWKLMRQKFDDGGFSGGNLNRPALKQLLGAVDRGEIDVIVVYKVDRLTRSLPDFAKMIEQFDMRGVSFVSVTQQFNTTSSMGRLTLNVLLSFAQFEREVTAERIRDKIAASKKKGLWMGGPTPLGYSVRNKRLEIDPAESKVVVRLFELYREHGTVDKLVEVAGQLGIVSKRMIAKTGRETGGTPFNRNSLYRLLRNPIYIGRIRHKDETFPGQHDAIIDEDLWLSTQKQLDSNAKDRATARNAKSHALLAGLLYDETGDPLRLTHTGRKSKRYRYYVSKRLLKNANRMDGWRLPDKEIEAAVRGIVSRFLLDQRRLADAMSEAGASQPHWPEVFEKATLLEALIDEVEPHQKGALFQELLQRVEIKPDAIVVEFNTGFLFQRLGIRSQQTKSISVAEPASMRRRGIEAKLIIQSQEGVARRVDPKLCQTIAKARLWFETLAKGKVDTVRELAKLEKTSETEITRLLPLAFLAPDIVRSILDGKQPVELTATSLRRLSNLPSDWAQQRRILGFQPIAS